ncbi:MAG: DUF2192 domain-containing protein [Sulfolobales archaeon]
MDVKRKRLKILVDVWGEIITRSSEKLTREEVIEILRRRYEKDGVEPVRGAANPSDIYERDLIALYLVGVEGLGIASELPKHVLDIFEQERRYVEAVEMILKDDNNGLRDKLIQLFGSPLDSAKISKIFRVELLRYYYGFKDRDDMPRIIEALSKAFPEEEKTSKRLSKFYIAVKVAEAIIKGEVRDWATKEALKQAIAVKLGSPRALPDDNYISKIIQTVFGIKASKYNKILRIEAKESGKKEERAREGSN